jgi:hypothetical protein
LKRLCFQASAKKTKLARLHFNKKLGDLAHTCHPKSLGSISRKTKVQTYRGKNGKIYLRKESKKDWGVVEHLPRKYKVLISNPNTT